MSDDWYLDMSGTIKMVKALDEMGKSPQKAVTRAASKGITPVRKAVKGVVPVRTGTLKRAIIRKAERSRVRGKKVYEATFDPSYNDVLQKPIKSPGRNGGKNPKAYYPASQEYGFLTRKNGSIIYVPGLHFMRTAAEETEPQSKQIMVDTMDKELDKLWQTMKHD